MYKAVIRTSGFVFNNCRNSRIINFSSEKHKISNQSEKLISSLSNIQLSRPQNRNMASSSSSTPDKPENPKYTNRLAQQKSPYLLQHAHNPVDWYPWGDEAIQKAKKEDKLIFLSVGYSTCHWCHVMEHESFENEEVAKIMNENFINIKVDREERPDIDMIYMNFVVLVSGSGGWPMSVWLTPDLTPVTGGTYFPPTDKFGMPGFTTVLLEIAKKWKKEKSNMTSIGQNIIEAITKSLSKSSISDSGPMTTERILNKTIQFLEKRFDSEYGGFESHPKFPQVSRLNFVFHAFTVTKNKEHLKMVLKTLEKIGNGGIHDHVFGGFARYSVDREWHIPHFEKMLYDQGQLLSAYVNAYQITRNKFYLKLADGIFRYIMKDLHHPEGGFYSGEDADSLPTHNDTKKIEGAFYAWTYSEIRDAIEKNSSKFDTEWKKVFEIYSDHYDIREKGNVRPSSDPHGHLTAKNVLIVRTSEKEICEKYKISEEQLGDLLHRVNSILHEIRDKRPRPHLDTKIITAWNGLVLSGLSELINCNNKEKNEYLEAAKAQINFLKKYSYDKEKKVLLRACYGYGTTDNKTDVPAEPINGFLVDYALLIKGLLDYYRSTLEVDILEWARELQDTQDRLFWDSKSNGYFYSQENSPNVIIRLKEDQDGAEPCGNSVAAQNLLLLSAYYEDKSYKEKAKQLFDFFSTDVMFGYAFPQMMSALLMYERGLQMAAIVGPEGDEVNEFLNVCRKHYIPGMIVIHFDPSDSSKIKRKTIEKFKMVNGKPAVYICHNKACQLPITDPQKLEEDLNKIYKISKK